MTMVSLEHEKPPLTGTFSFDGEVFEQYGFHELHSVRIPVALMRSAELSLERGMLKTPHLKIEAGGGCLGVMQGIDPSEAEEAPLRALVGEIQAAIEMRGWQD